MSLLKTAGLSILLFFLTACQMGNCRSNRTESERADKKAIAESITGTHNRLKIFKYDGSLQCGMGKAISIIDAQKELNGITVYSSDNKSDGMMRIQVCGSPTGRANVFEIDKASLDKAKSIGFKEWTFN